MLIMLAMKCGRQPDSHCVETQHASVCVRRHHPIPTLNALHQQVPGAVRKPGADLICLSEAGCFLNQQKLHGDI